MLIRIVKECQRSNCTGSFGIWKQYLVTHVDHKASAGPNDPAKRPWQVLAGFLESLSKEDDVKVSLASLPTAVCCVLCAVSHVDQPG